MWKYILHHMWTTKVTNQPAHPHSLISTFVVHCLDSKIRILALPKVSRFWLVSVAEQASLNFTWSKISEDTFSIFAWCGSIEGQSQNFREVFEDLSFHRICPSTKFTWEINSNKAMSLGYSGLKVGLHYQNFSSKPLVKVWPTLNKMLFTLSKVVRSF